MVSTKKQSKNDVEISLEYANNIIATLREPFLVINKDLRIVSANSSFFTTFKVNKNETIGQLLPDLALVSK